MIIQRKKGVCTLLDFGQSQFFNDIIRTIIKCIIQVFVDTVIKKTKTEGIDNLVFL